MHVMMGRSYTVCMNADSKLELAVFIKKYSLGQSFRFTGSFADKIKENSLRLLPIATV